MWVLSYLSQGILHSDQVLQGHCNYAYSAVAWVLSAWEWCDWNSGSSRRSFWTDMVVCDIRYFCHWRIRSACHDHISIAKVIGIIAGGEHRTLESGETLVINDAKIAPFSWMKYIVLSREAVAFERLYLLCAIGKSNDLYIFVSQFWKYFTNLKIGDFAICLL